MLISLRGNVVLYYKMSFTVYFTSASICRSWFELNNVSETLVSTRTIHHWSERNLNILLTLIGIYPAKLSWRGFSVLITYLYKAENLFSVSLVNYPMKKQKAYVRIICHGSACIFGCSLTEASWKLALLSSESISFFFWKYCISIISGIVP